MNNLNNSLKEKPSKKLNIFEVIDWLDKNEVWISTSKEFNKKSILVINDLSKSPEADFIETFEEFSYLIEMSAYLRFDIFLRMFSELGIKQDGFGGTALMFCYDGLSEKDNRQKSEMNVILQRIGLMIKAEIVDKVFGKENRNRVLSTIEEIKEHEEEKQGEF